MTVTQQLTYLSRMLGMNTDSHFENVNNTNQLENNREKNIIKQLNYSN